MSTELERQAAQNIINRTHRRAPRVFDVLQYLDDDTRVMVRFVAHDEVLWLSRYLFEEELKRITPDPMVEAFTLAFADKARRDTMPDMDTKQTITIPARQLQLDDVILRERERRFVVTSVGRTQEGHVIVCLANTFHWEFDNDENVTVER